jgi:Tol biopolymer transport system component
LSPDGKWVFAASSPDREGDWFLLPTGPGSPRKLDRGPIRTLVEADWLADGQRVVLAGREHDATSRLYVLDVGAGTLRRVSDEAVSLPENAAGPDGHSAFVRVGGRSVLFPLDGGEPRPIHHLAADDSPLQLSPDGRFAYVRRGPQVPAEIDRVDLASGARTHWRTLSPRDPVGVMRVEPVVLLPEGRSYCYSYTRVLSDLFLVEGLR